MEVAHVLKEKFLRELNASVNAKMMNYLTQVVTVTLAVTIKLFPTDNAHAHQAIPSTIAVFVLFPAPITTSPSWEVAPFVPSTPFTNLKSMDVAAPMVTIRTPMVFALKLC